MQTCQMLMAQQSIYDMFALIELYGRKVQSVYLWARFDTIVLSFCRVMKISGFPAFLLNKDYKWKISGKLLSMQKLQLLVHNMAMFLVDALHAGTSNCKKRTNFKWTTCIES